MPKTFDRHTVYQFDEDLHALHFQVVEMGELVLNQLCLALESLDHRDLSLALSIIDRERVVNDMEASAETVVCSILARRCPKGSDLRMVIAASRIVDHFKQIGDEAVKLANFVIVQDAEGGDGANRFPFDEVGQLGRVTIDFVRWVLEAFERLDIEPSGQINARHRTLEQHYQHGLHRLMAFLQAEKTSVSNAVSQVLMMSSLECIGDLARRIAELVIYQISGEEPRHQLPVSGRDFTPDE